MTDRVGRRALTLGLVLSALAGLLVVAARRPAEPRPATSVALTTLPTADEKERAPAPAAPNAAALQRAQPPAAASGGPAPAAFDEGDLMRALRGAREHDPALAVELAREGNRRFPNSADAPERSSILIHALAEQGLAAEARGAAEEMVNQAPDSAWVREIEQFTGAHRHRNVRVDERGRLRYADPPPT
jgi:hypothetical protein